MEMNGRKWQGTANNFRYTYNGKEDDKVSGWQTQDYGFRTYDYRLGRFYSQDPLYKEFPDLTTYQFAGNRPIEAIDLDGKEPKYANSSGYLVSGSDKLYNGNPDFKPKIKEPVAKTTGESVFPEKNENLVFKTSLSVGEYKLVNFDKTIVGSPDYKAVDAKTVLHKENENDFVFFGGGKEVTTKEIYSKVDIRNMEGEIILPNQNKTTKITERKEKLSIGRISIESKEIFVDGKKESYKMRLGIDLSRDLKISPKKESETGLKTKVGVDINTDWIDVKSSANEAKK